MLKVRCHLMSKSSKPKKSGNSRIHRINHFSAPLYHSLPRPALPASSSASSNHSSSPPLLVALVGGSGSGKSWLAKKLLTALRGKAAHLSLDDFYRDCSHLPPQRRGKLNFDNPSSIDWLEFGRVLHNCRNRTTAQLPRYSFKTHCRLRGLRTFRPKPIILIDGLWLLRRPQIRRLFGFRIFLECPVQTRLRRRLARDRRFRGRSRHSVQAQFWKTVAPMHRKFVQPQRRWADTVLRGRWGESQIQQLSDHLRAIISPNHGRKRLRR